MKKKGESSNIKIGLAIILGFVILGIATTMPWLFVILVPIGIGIAIGRINDKLPKKKTVTSGSSPLSVSVNNDLRIMTDSLDLLNTSTNLQTVVSRYDTLVSALQRLVAYEGNPAVSFPHELPSAALARISAEKPEIFNRAIRRAYDRVLHECAALKTEKGRRNRHQKFFAELSDLMDSFPPATREFAAQFILDNQDDPLTGLEGL